MANLHLRNPHSVLAVLEKRPQDVLQITVPPQAREGWSQVLQVARSKGVKVHEAEVKGKSQGQDRGSRNGGDRSRGGDQGRRSQNQAIKAIVPEEGGRAGMAEAIVREKTGLATEELFEGAKDAGSGLWLALDCLTDPHNVGAIFRAAAFFGVRGILLTQERSAPLTSTVYDVACGGVDHVPFVLQTNLQRGFEVAKEAGLWILGSSEHAKQDFATVERDRPWLLVLGNEERGMRRLTEEACDVLAKIPAKGGVTSLNVSVAAGVMISKLA